MSTTCFCCDHSFLTIGRAVWVHTSEDLTETLTEFQCPACGHFTPESN